METRKPETTPALDLSRRSLAGTTSQGEPDSSGRDGKPGPRRAIDGLERPPRQTRIGHLFALLHPESATGGVTPTAHPSLPSPSSSALAPDAAMALMVVGAVVGLAVLLPGTAPLSSNSFIRTPAALAFVGVIALQSGVWAMMALPLSRVVVALWRFVSDGKDRFRAVFAAAAFWALVWGSSNVPPRVESPLAGEAPKTNVLFCIGALLGALAVAGLGLVYGAAREHLPGPNREAGAAGPRADSQRAVDLYLTLHRYLLRLVVALGLMVAFAVLAGETLHVALLSGLQREPQNYPARAVVGYGLYGAALVAFVSLPYHLALRVFARRIRDVFYGVLAPGAVGYAERRRERFEVEQVLGLNIISMDVLRTSLAILAPVASGIVSLLLPQLRV